MMKMNAKKIGILALLAVIVVAMVIAVVLIIGRVGPGVKTGPGGITVPSGFTEYGLPFLDPYYGVTEARYIRSGTVEDAWSAFKASAIDAGWSPTEDMEEGILAHGIALFEKGDKLLKIQVGQVEDQVVVVALVMSKDIEGVPGEEIIPKEVKPPTSDTIGEDIPDVPRYPGSVRTNYASLGDERTRTTSVVYTTSASVDEVLRFYKKELPANGWINIGEIQTGDTFTLGGDKEGTSAQIHIYPDEYYPGHTSILIWIYRYQE